jgi:two-component system sensor histidine kinase ArlS
MERITKKLLPKTLRVYVIFALIVLLTGAPVFYSITRWLYIEDTNETLSLSKESFIKYALPHIKEKDIVSFNRLSWNLRISDAEKTIVTDVYQYRTFLDSIENEDEQYRVLLSPIHIENKPYTLLVRMKMIESEDLVESIAIIFVALIIILLAGLFVITRRLSQQIWKPFFDSLMQIEAFEIDKNRIPLWQPTDVEEFQRLNKAVNTLIERNVKIYKSQKEFVENAAHELQTPLAAFQAKLDSLMQTPSITSDQAEIIEDLAEAATRLNRLNKNLLLLSKLDKGLFQVTEEISINNAIEKMVLFFSNQYETRNIKFSFKNDCEVKVKANVALIDILISNVLLNSIKHNHDNGSVSLELKERKLTICNTGKPKPLDTAILFERFSKTDPSFTGSGLGLAIVNKIAGIYQWKIFYKWENNFHCFEVNF